MPRKESVSQGNLEYAHQNILITIRESDSSEHKEVVSDAFWRDSTSQFIPVKTLRVEEAQ